MNIDPDLVVAAKREIARQHGLDPDRSHRLVGGSAAALHLDAARMAASPILNLHSGSVKVGVWGVHERFDGFGLA